ncbi:MAG: helix-turn-helix transcriptional regulator [Ruminococcaceae bacterium]|nr:helix-turn-helix transcriptional regulator [Oscillospiraceae bacterium]
MEERFVEYAEEGADFYIADLLWEDGGRIAVHTHDFYEMFFVMQGEFSETANGRVHTVRRRYLHVMSPNDSHGFYAPSGYGKPCVLRNIVVKTTRFEQTLQKAGLSTESVCGYHVLDEHVFLSCVKKTDLVFGTFPCGKTFDFLMQNVLEDILAATVQKGGVDEHAPQWLKTVCAAMAEEENLQLGLPRLRALANRSPEHVNRSFQKFCQMSPTEYINSLRLELAARLLQMSEDRVLDVAFRCGFGSVSYFNRRFKERYGTTPQQYRESRKRLFMSL